jgi:hypothetical protein
MTIVNSAAITQPGFGAPAQVQQRQNLSLAGGTIQQWLIPVTGVLAQAFRCGKVRVKIYGGGGTAPTVLCVTVTATDGTTTEQVADVNPCVPYALGTDQVFDYLFTFILDINADVLAIGTTLGGTSPTATMDVEAILEP